MDDDCAGLFEHFPVQGVFPALDTFRSAGG